MFKLRRLTVLTKNFLRSKYLTTVNKLYLNKYNIPITTLSLLHFTTINTQTQTIDPMTTKVSTIIPKKSKSDKREYRLLTLDNGLECILISDPETDKAAAALDVHIGHFADPKKIPGLAHFCEHMLFLGTSKYPDESEYNKFLKEHSGSSNASTSMHDTCYQFDVGKEYLSEALDRFGQFFISPLFSESCTNREMNAVNSENQNNLQSDPHRLYQFDKSLAKEEHPFHKFGTGNLSTLRDDIDKDLDIREELLKFHKKYYSASIMKLAVLGHENLDKLQNMVVPIFSKISNNNIKAPIYSDGSKINNVFDMKTFPKLFKMYPVKERRNLILGFPLPSYYSKYNSRPISLLSYCLGDEGPGSILQYLKSLGYATSLSAGTRYNIEEFSMLELQLDITKKGLEKWEEIVTIIFSYIKSMTLLNDSQWLNYFKERKNLRNMNFEFKGKERVYNYVTSLAKNIHRYGLNENLLKYQNRLLFEFSLKEIKEYLSYLTIDNTLIQLVGKEFDNDCKESEKWYGTKYSTIKINNDQINKWNLNNIKNNNNLSCPPPNKYIPDNFDIRCDDSKLNEEINDIPLLIESCDNLDLWYKMDNTFKQPKILIVNKLISYNIHSTLDELVHTELLVLLFEDMLSQYTYVFEEAGLSYNVSFDGNTGINFKFFGYNQKIELLIKEVLDKFYNLEDYIKNNKDKFNIIYEKRTRLLQSFRKSKCYQQLDLINTMINAPKGYSLDELENANKKITFNSFLKHYNNIFNKIRLEVFMYGNINKLEINNYKSLFNKYLIKSYSKPYKLNDYQNSLKGSLKLPFGKTFIFRYENLNSDDNNNGIDNVYIFKIDKPNEFAILKLFSHMIQQPAFDQLRTKEQLGYIVWSFADFVKGLMSFRVMVQGVNKDANYLDERIEDFLLNFRNTIVNMDDKTFELNKSAVIINLLEKTKHIAEQGSRWYNEVNNRRLQFNRHKTVAEYVKKLNKKDILDFYDNYISNKSNNRCKLSIQCFAKNNKIPKDSNDKNNIYIYNKEQVDQIRKEFGFYKFPYNRISKM